MLINYLVFYFILPHSSPSLPFPMQPGFEEKMRSLAKSTVNTKRNGGLYQNVLMYGPPGTGKTMFAKVKGLPA